jgi:uncharacterized membrane protein
MPMNDPPRTLLFRLSNQKGRVPIAFLVAIMVYLLTFPLETGLRISLAYDLGVFTLLALQAYRFSRITAQDIQDYFQDREPSSRLIVLAAVVFSGLSMAGVGVMADFSRSWPPLQAHIHTAALLLAIVESWILLHVFYGIFYAHIYYKFDEGAPKPTLGKGLSFPNDDPPDYWDFLYYSFTIAMCYQTSDITVSSRSMRHVTLCHAVISFLFVTAILGLVINLLSNQI